jgi:hypothetical protein
MNIGRAIFLTHFAQEARIDVFGILQHLVFRPHQDIPKELTWQQIDPYRAEGGAGAAIDAGSGIEIVRQFHAFQEFRIDL